MSTAYIYQIPMKTYILSILCCLALSGVSYAQSTNNDDDLAPTSTTNAVTTNTGAVNNVPVKTTTTTTNKATDEDIKVTFSVVNMAEGNADATKVGAKRNDTLRYNISIDSETKDVEGFVATMDFSDVLKYAEIVTKGDAVLEGTTLKFPAFSQKAPCKKEFQVVVRMKNCGDDNIISAKSGNSKNDLNVKLDCPAEELPETGASEWYVIAALIALAGIVLTVIPSRFSTNK